jgi:hypothetical protein
MFASSMEHGPADFAVGEVLGPEDLRDPKHPLYFEVDLRLLYNKLLGIGCILLIGACFRFTKAYQNVRIFDGAWSGHNPWASAR